MVDPGESLQSSASDSYTAGGLADGDEISVLVTTTDGCTDVEKASAIIFDNPTAGISTSGVCAGEDATFKATPAGQANYEFFADANMNGMVDPGESLQSSASDSYTAGGLADGDEISVLVTTTDGCTDVEKASAIIFDNPTAGISTSGVCAGEDATFKATPAGQANYEFFADANMNGMVDPGESLQSSASDSYTAGGLADGDEISVLVTTTDGCTDVEKASAIIFDNPTAGISTSGVCAGEDATFKATPAGQANYEFFADANMNGMVDPGESLQSSASDSYTAGGLADGDEISVLVTTTDGCTDVEKASAIIFDNPPCSISGPTTVCSTTDDQIYFGPDGAGLTYMWTVTGDGEIDGTDNQRTIKVNPTGVGEYIVKLTVKADNGCEASCERPVTVVNCCSDETAFAYPGDVNSDANCFINNGGRSSKGKGKNKKAGRWGWFIDAPFNQSGDGLSYDAICDGDKAAYKYPLYAGAAHCEISRANPNGDPVGEISLVCNGDGDIEVHYTLYKIDGYTLILGTPHVYAGCTKVPPKLAPGQYPYKADAHYDSYAKVVIPKEDFGPDGDLSQCKDAFFLVAHAEVQVCSKYPPALPDAGIDIDEIQALGHQEIKTSGLEVSYYPNPARDVIHLDASGLQGSETTITLFDRIGRKIVEYPVQIDQIINLELSIPESVADGVYYLNVRNQTQMKTLPIVIYRDE